MWNKKLTLLLIHEATGLLRQLRIPMAAIYIVLGVAASLLLSNFFLSAQFFSEKVDDNELRQLRAENRELKGRYDRMRWSLAEVETRYSDLIEKEVYLRALFDLPQVESEERQLGVGGPVPAAIDSMSEAERTAIAAEADVERLLKLSEFELEKYSEVENSLLNIKERLDHTPSIWPTKGWFSRGFGMHLDPFTGIKQMHEGVDIANHRGTPIVAPANGRVARVQRNTGGLGLTIIIKHGFGIETVYGHLTAAKVVAGQKVERGELIGFMGATGYATGPHLHYEVLRNGRNIDPMQYILNTM
ncbi:MAG TPA: M23 family metallopeptidase [Candidatus Deferrimicrobium sp.]|nr:M23 family metallopeptidase [Candidatus Deferrimicrobium sp.]